MGRAATLLVLALVATACSSTPAVTDRDCDELRTAFAAPAVAADLPGRIASLRALDERFPGQRLATWLTVYEVAERELAAAADEREAFAAALTFAAAMHDLADDAPVDAELATAARDACTGLADEVLLRGADGRTPEPDTTIGIDDAGAVDAFVETLAEAHRRTDGRGCDVLRDGLDIDPRASATPHLNADALSGELGCVFTDPTGPVLLVVLAADGDVPSRLRPLVEGPGRVRSLADVFGLAQASGFAAFDALSDGWLLVLTPGEPDPRVALDRLVATLR